MSSRSTSNSAERASDNQTGKSNDKFLGCCANCGIRENGDIKLKICTACKSVHYCGVECQKKHRPKHKKYCEERAAELRDELLFKQPESTHRGDCPICCLPLPNATVRCSIKFCCSQIICLGCSYANLLRQKQLGPERKCPFCRSPTAETPAQELKYRMKRIEANCPVAICHLGLDSYNDGKYKEAFNSYTKAAELGNVGAHYHLATLYFEGKGVEEDERKGIKHAETAAIGGHPGARVYLYYLETKKGNINRAVKHLVIAAKQGTEHTIGVLMKLYKDFEEVSKEVLDEALRGYQEALNAIKSPQRDAAEEALRLLDD